MIELENLNNRSLEDILDESKKQILYLTTQWNNFQEADPGITLVELFSWLKHVQHEYLNRDFESIHHKFLSLLDIKLQESKGSETLLEVSDTTDDVNIPMRTRFKSGNMIFENVYPQTSIKSKILSVHFENSDINSEEEYYKFDGNRKFYLFGQNINKTDPNKEKINHRFTINFDAPILKNTEIGLYFSIYTDKDLYRNPVKKNDEFVEMAKVKWEYPTEKGWEKLEILNDYTHNFLFSGIVRFKLANNIKPIDGQYKIRVNLLYDEYDYPPRITNILPNIFKVVQNHTACENTIIKKSDLKKDGSFEIYSHTALYGENEVFVSRFGGWKKIEIDTEKKDIKNGKVKIMASNTAEYAKNVASDDSLFMVISYDKEIKNKIILKSGTGASFQYAEISDENILKGNLEIMVAENIDNEEIFYKWSAVTDFSSSGKYDRHFVYNKEQKGILFGDHINGMAPRKIKNGIRLCGMKYSFAANSNTKEGMVNSVTTENKILKKARIEQIIPATGGEDDETLNHGAARAANLFADPKRIITKSDYEKIIYKTPGLMFINVKIMPNYMKGENIESQNCVTVAVRWNRKIGLELPKSYERNIMNQIEKYRLLNTKVKVVAPEYIGLIISADLVVDPSYREKDKLIEKEIYEFVENLNKDLGQPLHFGDLFGMIDRLKYVSILEKLKILPNREHIEKNVSEDIIIPPNGVYYIEKINLNFARSSYI